jgi:TetR/AcrR family tetracycline transcriptional repressor
VTTTSDDKIQRRLDPIKVVESALVIAESEGLAAITIRRLAQDHGVTPMALYRHFRDKEELLDAVVEQLLSEVVLPEPTDRPWHEQMRAVLAAVLDVFRPHPNTAGLTLTRILLSDPGLALAERTLGLLVDGAGFPKEEAAEIASQSICSLITLVATEPGAGLYADTEAREDAVRRKRAMLMSVSPRRYPHVVAAADALSSCADRDGYFDFGIDLVVAGMRGVSPA